MKKKLLVLGATGFIGRNIVEYYSNQKEYEVYGTYYKSAPLNNPRIQMLQANLTRVEDVDMVIKGKDVVIHSAATTSGAKDIVSKPYIHVTDNAVMTSLVQRSAFEHSIKHLICFSCTVMYHTSEIPLIETDFDANREIHKNYFGAGWMKVYTEKMCEFYSRLGQNKYTVLRHSNIYGPHDKFDLEKSHVFGSTMSKVMTTDGEKIVVWGSGEEGRDLLYITDLVHAVDLALERQQTPFELLNIGLGKAISIKTLVQKIIEFSGKNLTIEFDLSKPTIKTHLCLDCAKAKIKLGWTPQVSLEEGIKKTMKWYKENYLNYQNL